MEKLWLLIQYFTVQVVVVDILFDILLDSSVGNASASYSRDRGFVPTPGM